MRAVVLALLIASPAVASGDAVAEWRDLQARCEAAVFAGAALDVDGLEGRAPTRIARVVDEAPFGVRIEHVPLRTSARTVPTGIWGALGGRFEMVLLEFPTQAGVRAICEVGVARGAAALDAGTKADLVVAFVAMQDARVASGDGRAEARDDAGGAVRIVTAGISPNPRDCPVVASLIAGPSSFRSSAAERAGAPGCGGPSLAGGLTRTPASLNEGNRP